MSTNGTSITSLDSSCLADPHIYTAEVEVDYPQSTLLDFIDPMPFDVEAICYDAIFSMGPLTLNDLMGAVCGMCMEDDDGCLIVLECEDVGWACVELYHKGKIIMPTAKNELLDYDDILDVPDLTSPIDMEPIKVIELFAGIGAFRKGLTNLGIPHTAIMSEIDKFAVKSYNAIHGETPNLGDITKIEKLPSCDLLTYGFPCQDISAAGNQKGFEKGSGTRSSLLWEVERLLREYSPEERPAVLIMENVKNLVAKKNMRGFEQWIATLEELGYTSSWKILDPTEFGIPQNRPRVFLVSCLNGVKFEFPESTGKMLTLKDIREIVPMPLNPEDCSDIRCLTERECFKLMGFTVRDQFRASEVVSSTQQYKQCGNSIVVNVVQAILKKLYIREVVE